MREGVVSDERAAGLAQHTAPAGVVDSVANCLKPAAAPPWACSNDLRHFLVISLGCYLMTASQEVVG